MTDFRRVRCLHAYSGGTVPDSNRVHYFPPIPVEISGPQMLYSILYYQNFVCQAFANVCAIFLSYFGISILFRKNRKMFQHYIDLHLFS